MVSRKNQRKKSNRIQKRSKRIRKRILDGGEPISIIIRDFDGKRYELKIDTDNTIESIISKCREKSPIDETEFKYVLKLGSVILSDCSKTISEYGIANESTLHLSYKKLPSPFCGLYAFTDHDSHSNIRSILILNDDNTGHHIVSHSQNSVNNTYTNDVVWINSNNILKVLIITKPMMDNKAIVRHGSRQIFLINTTNYFGYYKSIRYVSPSFKYFTDEYKRKDFVFEELLTKESRIEFLNNFNPLIDSLKNHSVFGSVNQKLLRVSFDGREFVEILEDLESYSNMFFLEHMIKVFRYMDKGVFSEVFEFDNPENMKKSIEMMFPLLFSRSADDTVKKQLMAVIDRIPGMDIF